MEGYNPTMWSRNPHPMQRGMAASRDTSHRPAPLSTLQFKDAEPIKQQQMTPPETPISPELQHADLSHERSRTPEPLFHNYLRVLHAFDPLTEPSTNGDEDSITVPIKQGDLILVHSIHENGWADGTLFSSGRRGWVPTNYCEPYDHPYIRNLLNAMTQFWDLLEDSESASFKTFMRQDYIRGLIAGVRYLLEHASCLHRDSSLVQQNVGIRRMRKGLLADLSSMVSKAKELQDEASQPYAGEIIHIVLDELITKAFRVVTRAVRFVDAWTQEAMTGTSSRRSSKTETTMMSPLDVYFGTEVTNALQSPTQNQHSNQSDILSDDEGQIEQEVNAIKAAVGRRRKSTIHSPRPSGTSHRLSLIREERRSGTTASEQLSQAHDLCISHIGKFLGHHLHSRSHSELLDTTQCLTSVCQRMLAVMDQVNASSAERSTAIEYAKEALLEVLHELVQSTKEVFTFSDLPDDDAVIMPDQANRLVTVGTSLIRSVGECVAQTRRRLEQTGDFQLQEPPICEEQDLRPTHKSNPSQAVSVSLSAAGSDEMSEEARKRKTLPPLPPVDTRMSRINPLINDIGMPSPAITVSTNSPVATSAISAPEQIHSRAQSSHAADAGPMKGTFPFSSDVVFPERKDSVSTCVTESFSTQASLSRDSEMSTVSEASTRASTPDGRKNDSLRPRHLTSFGSVSSMTSANTEADNDSDAALLQKTYAHEMILNHQGQITGGSLNAIVEKLTTHDATPDLNFATTFYLTFRLFTTPRSLTRALIERFDYVGDSPAVEKPVRLRICQCFKGWLETYWNSEADKEALEDIKSFAQQKLKPVLPSAAERLLELTRRITAACEGGTVVEPLISGVGKSTMLVDTRRDADSAIPSPAVTKASLNVLKNGLEHPTDVSVLDVDPLEIARQLTLMTSRIYCEIKSAELLSCGFAKGRANKSSHVLAMQKFSTDLAHMVNENILAPTEVKKRALVIKQWIKIAACCLDIRNFECLVAIVSAVDNTPIKRLKRTWEVVNKKSKAKLDELRLMNDYPSNWVNLRHHVEEAAAPCLPFLGIYCKDLTFINDGNSSTRQLPGSASAPGEHATTVINFDKYARMAKIVSQVQRFQIPHRLQPVPELQAWLEAYLQHMRQSHAEMAEVAFHRRSLILEPRDEHHRPSLPTAHLMLPRGGTVSEPVTPIERPKLPTDGEDKEKEKDKPEPVAKDHSRMDLFWKHNTFGLKAAFGGRADVNANAA
ncbi:hypothetical protein Q7P37_008782 [Cladosporium fusiforme]